MKRKQKSSYKSSVTLLNQGQ